MQTRFHNKKITSILGILPENEYLFDDEVNNYDFPPKQTMRLKKIMGYNKHRISKETTTVSDLAVFGLKHMLDNGLIAKEDIGAIVAVTLCPDHFVPHVSNIVHAKAELGTDVLCMDIPQGCCGFLLGLSQAFMLLEHMDNKKVVLINGDILSHKVSKRDRNDFPLIGDGAAITIVENSAEESEIYYEMHMDGSRRDALIIPAGGFRMPSNEQTAVMENTGDGNYRSLDNMHMDGSAVFNFVQTEVPPMLEHAFSENNITPDDIDYFLFHQPNKFMLEKLAEKSGIPKDKLPMNLVENCGNTSGACIPMVAALNLSHELVSGSCRCCLSAFGSGLAWGTMIMELGPLEHCEIIVSDL
ncbi:MAG: 3-oxoacyl-ACP synthase III family protein [Huintestinicola sp.]